MTAYFSCLVITALLLAITSSYQEEKVAAHFRFYDKNQNGLLERTQYVEQLKEEDETGDEQDGEYYYEITSLLYEQYDKDRDLALSIQEWRQFSKDILDEDSPEYQQILADPGLKQLEL